MRYEKTIFPYPLKDPAQATEHRTRYHYTLEGDSLLLLGFRNPTTLMDNSQPELLVRFPLSYGEQTGSYFYGHGKYGNRLELDMMGTISTKMDAYGMMILPGGDTLRHVVRTHTLKLMAEDIHPITRHYAANNKMGNITCLQRFSPFGSIRYLMDNLAITYTGNQLERITDSGEPSMGFVASNIAGPQYVYNKNGAMIQDKNKGITAINYNLLNLPQRIDFEDRNAIIYLYDATGLPAPNSFNPEAQPYKRESKEYDEMHGWTRIVRIYGI